MSLRYLLDTDICIYLARNQPPAVAERLARVPLETVAISVVTYGELAYGAERSQRTSETLAQLERFASVVRVLPLDAGVSAQYGRVRAALERRGLPIGANDLWIAAHALALKVTLVTDNGREFRRVRGLRVENWVR